MRRKVRKEAKRVENETGIDFSRYRNPEIAERIGELVDFTGQAGSLLLKYFSLLFIVTVGFGLWGYSQDSIGVLGLVLFLSASLILSICGAISLAAMRLVSNVVEDSAAIIVLMLDFLREVRDDLLTTSGKTSGDTSGISVPSPNLLEGLSYFVFIPSLSYVVRRKLGWLAWPVNFLSETIMYYFTRFVAGAMKVIFKSPENKIKGEGKETAADENQETASGFRDGRGKIRTGN